MKKNEREGYKKSDSLIMLRLKLPRMNNKSCCDEKQEVKQKNINNITQNLN